MQTNLIELSAIQAAAGAPDLSAYDLILVSTSAGKDSQAMLDYVVELAGPALRERIVAVHADLGRVVWKGTAELAAEQAAHYGIRFEMVRRTKNDLLDQVEARGMWPSSSSRYCTSDHKRGPILTVITKLVEELRAELGRPVRVLQCIGLRAEESSARAKLAVFERNARATNGRRIVDDWLPIHAWTVGQVWERIRASGVRHHYAYDLGMPRLSCVFCIFAPEKALLLAGKHNPELLDAYVAVEEKIGHTFKANMALKSIKVKLERGAAVERADDWKM
jgi:3'-phosphoadenosine 5'-phosphosulfate sulfotransferase (PAPS reductase)/FAD synthetase